MIGLSKRATNYLPFHHRYPSSHSSSTRLFLNSPHDKYFQLEEAEDVETCTTEVFLHADSSVWIGESDGPLCSNAQGSWNVEPDGTFRMTISRMFDTGQPAADFTDMGEFSFSVVREFTGEMTTVASLMAMSGSLHDVDEVFGDRQVGFFSMIDTTDARLGLDNNENDEQLPTNIIGRTQTSR